MDGWIYVCMYVCIGIGEQHRAAAHDQVPEGEDLIQQHKHKCVYMYIHIYIYIYIHMYDSSNATSSNTASFVLCGVCSVEDHHSALHSSPLLKESLR